MDTTLGAPLPIRWSLSCTPRGMVANDFDRRRAVGGGIIAGLVSGLALSVFQLALAISTGRNPFIVFKAAAAPFLGERALQPGFDAGAIVAGAACHFAVAAVWGLLFGVLFYGLGRGVTMVVGLFYGLVVWLAMNYVLLPLLGRASMARATPIGIAVAAHLLFGLILAAAFLPFQREIRTPRLQRYPT